MGHDLLRALILALTHATQAFGRAHLFHAYASNHRNR